MLWDEINAIDFDTLSLDGICEFMIRIAGEGDNDCETGHIVADELLIMALKIIAKQHSEGETILKITRFYDPVGR